MNVKLVFSFPQGIYTHDRFSLQVQESNRCSQASSVIVVEPKKTLSNQTCSVVDLFQRKLAHSSGLTSDANFYLFESILMILGAGASARPLLGGICILSGSSAVESDFCSPKSVWFDSFCVETLTRPLCFLLKIVATLGFL